MNQRRWVRHNKISVSILIFILLFGVINLIKPVLMYNDDGSMKEFGVGFRKKTIIPVWLLSIMLGIISYYSVMYYTAVFR